MISSPYSFVPFNREHTYHPDWAPFISQDIPFRDGLSGVLDIQLTTNSPLFIRNGSLMKLDEKGDPIPSPEGFSKDSHGRYFIPGTSIKGMVRSVLEILSFGKMSFFNDNRYAVRDLSSANNFYLSAMKEGKTLCGFLKKKDGKYVIINRGEPIKVKHKYIDHVCPNFSNFFTIGGGYKGTDERHKSARFKYDQFKGSGVFPNDADFIKLPEEHEAYRVLKQQDYDDPSLAEKIIGGCFVFTGQPMVGNKAKQVEYFFKKDANNPVQDSQGRVYPRNIDVEEQVIQDFKFAYFEHDPNRQSIDWKYWRKELEKGEKIPVFFQVDKNNRVQHLGLSYLYKLPYKYKVGDYLSSLQPAKKDLAECIFGQIPEAKQTYGSIKGRVHFGHAFAEGSPSFLPTKEVTLSEPKASFYPNYIVQDTTVYRTYMKAPKDQNGQTRLAGWKRYPVHASSVNKLDYIQDNRSTNDNVKTTIEPMHKGSNFTFKICYHNLRPAELGALIQSMELSSGNNVYHKLGMAKPLGCGEVSLKVLNSDINGKDKKYFLSCFETVMNKHLQMFNPVQAWVQTPTVRELFAVSTDSHAVPQNFFYYPNGGIVGQNDFQTYKTQKESLELFSVRARIRTPLQSFYQPTMSQQDDFSQAASTINQVAEKLHTVQKEYTKALRAAIKALIAAK